MKEYLVSNLDISNYNTSEQQSDRPVYQYVTNRIVPKSLRELFLKHYPGLEKNPTSYWGLMQLLTFGTWKNKSNKIIINQGLLASVEGKYKQLVSNRYAAIDLLKRFQTEVMSPLTFEWNEHSFAKGVARSVYYFILDGEVQDALRKYYKNPLPEGEDLVYFINGKKPSKAKVKCEREIVLAIAQEVACFADCEVARKLLNYLNNLDPTKFNKIVRSNIDKAVSAAYKLDGEHNDFHNLRLLKAIEAQPKPFYQPSVQGNTVRVFGLNDSMLMLNSSIRKVLTSGWVEADLKSAQLAIVATDWDIPIVKEFLANGHSIWQHLLELLGIDYVAFKDMASPDKLSNVKQVVKKPTYSCIFDMGRVNNIKQINRLVEELCFIYPEFNISDAGKKFYSSPLIQALEKAKKKRKDELMLAGYVVDIFGKRHEVTSDSFNSWNERSLLALLAQATELYLLEPAIDYVINSNDVDIALWQHDGMSLQFRNPAKKERQLKQIKQLVKERANELDIITELEVN